MIVLTKKTNMIAKNKKPMNQLSFIKPLHTVKGSTAEETSSLV